MRRVEWVYYVCTSLRRSHIKDIILFFLLSLHHYKTLDIDASTMLKESIKIHLLVSQHHSFNTGSKHNNIRDV